MPDWYTIDTVGKLFPSVLSQNNSSFFRLTVVLKEPVQVNLFQEAVDTVRQRFSFFFVRLRKGVFWNYLESDNNPYVVEEETEAPCSPLKKAKIKNKLVRFLYYKNRLTIEMSHVISDGNGAFEILKAVLLVYFSLQGFEIDPENKILHIDEVPTIKDYENSFTRYTQNAKAQKEFNRAKRASGKKEVKRAYQIRGTAPAIKGTNAITGLVSASALKTCAKAHGTTINGYVISLLMYSLFSVQIKYGRNKKPISVALPVNLRRHFPSSTLRNFFAVPNIAYKCTPETTLADIIEQVNAQMSEVLTKENFQDEINRHSALADSTLTNLIPLNLKHPIIKAGFFLFGESKKTITLSNMGAAQFPKDIEKFIEHTEAILYPTALSPINCALSSVHDVLSITFSLAIVETDIVRCFFTLLQEQTGFDISVYSTPRGGSNEV